MKTKKVSKNTNFPSENILKGIRKKYSRGIASRPLAQNATQAERLKHFICREFVTFSNAHHITNRDMAKRLDVAESLMSKLLHYQFDEFTLDRLLNYLSRLYSEVEITIKVAGERP